MARQLCPMRVQQQHQEGTYQNLNLSLWQNAWQLLYVHSAPKTTLWLQKSLSSDARPEVICICLTCAPDSLIVFNEKKKMILEKVSVKSACKIFQFKYSTARTYPFSKSYSYLYSKYDGWWLQAHNTTVLIRPCKHCPFLRWPTISLCAVQLFSCKGLIR